MLLEVRIRLTSPILGDCFAGDRRKFKRIGNDPTLLDARPDIWSWALRTAFESLRIKADPDTIKVASVMRAPRLCHIFRSSRLRKESNDPRGRDVQFEAIDRGTTFTLNFVLTPTHGGATQVASFKDVADALSFVGQFLGISHWGNDLDYGRFIVISVAPTTEFFHCAPHIDTHSSSSSDQPLQSRLADAFNVRAQVDERKAGD